MKKIFFICSAFILLFSCGEESGSKNPYAAFFFPYQKDAKIYVYRDVVHGLNERFLRIYSVEDSKGKHIIVENYSMDGRITEAHNYNMDSLTIIDHMVVNGNGQQTKALLLKNGMFPMEEKKAVWFASKFPGFFDSTIILNEIRRSFDKATPFSTKVMNEAKNTISTIDTVRLTQVNPYTKKENAQQVVVKSYFAEGLGLVRFHDTQMKTDYRLEKIMEQADWVRMMQR